MADEVDSKSIAEKRVGSSPTTSTNIAPCTPYSAWVVMGLMDYASV